MPPQNNYQKKKNATTKHWPIYTPHTEQSFLSFERKYTYAKVLYLLIKNHDKPL